MAISENGTYKVEGMGEIDAVAGSLVAAGHHALMAELEGQVVIDQKGIVLATHPELRDTDPSVATLAAVIAFKNAKPGTYPEFTEPFIEMSEVQAAKVVGALRLVLRQHRVYDDHPGREVARVLVDRFSSGRQLQTV